MIDNQNFLSRIKDTVLATETTAKVILFGSRARGDARPDSDWDILILSNQHTISPELEKTFFHNLLDIELDTGNIISTFVYSFDDWNTKYLFSSFYKSVTTEGIGL